MKQTCLLLLSMVNPEKIIKNNHLPSCRNCIYYEPYGYSSDFNSLFSKCNKFGEKNIITDEVKYKYVDSCRDDESKCGKEGKYFVEEPNISMKIWKHKIIHYSPYFVTVLIVIISGFSQLEEKK